MNEDGLRLLSTALGFLFLISLASALLVLWANWRSRREARNDDTASQLSRLKGAQDEGRRE